MREGVTGHNAYRYGYAQPRAAASIKYVYSTRAVGGQEVQRMKLALAMRLAIMTPRPGLHQLWADRVAALARRGAALTWPPSADDLASGGEGPLIRALQLATASLRPTSSVPCACLESTHPYSDGLDVTWTPNQTTDLFG